MEGILQSIITAGYRQLEGRGLALYRYDPLSESFPDVWQLEEGQLVRRYASSAFRSAFTSRILHHGVPVVIQDTQKAEGLSPYLPASIRSFVALPVFVHGVPWGVLYVNSSHPGAFLEDDLAFLQSLARQLGTFVQETPGNSGSVELSTVRVLAATVDAKDPYTRHHSTNVSFYARRLAREMNLDPAEVRRIELAGLLHDIGKIAIPDQILQKPGKLTAEERVLIQTHAAIGANMLAQASHLSHLVPLIRHHHEWYNGNGYPDGLKGNEIPLGAAILSMADAFDTMTSRRVYRAALTLEDAVAEMRRCSGTQFHPDVVQAMESLVEKASYTRESWLLSLGTAQEFRINMPETPVLRNFEGVEESVGPRWDPLEFLVEAGTIHSHEDLAPVLERGVEQALHFWQAEAVMVYLVNRHSGMLKLAWSDGSAQQFLTVCREEAAVPVTQGLLGWTALTGRGVGVPDARRDPRWPYSAQFEGAVSVLLSPIIASGAVLGVIQIVSQGESRFGRNDLKVVQVFSSLLGHGIERVQAFKESQEAYCTDSLTGVRNANYLRVFLERLDHGGVAGPLSVAFIDGDDLKGVNDRHGHEAGDRIIRHIARCLTACHMGDDVIIRYAGDEFLIFFPGVPLPEAAARLEKMRMAVAETPVELEGYRVYVSISCGVTEVDPALGPHKAVRAAEQAMYNAKRTGKNRVWTAAG